MVINYIINNYKMIVYDYTLQKFIEVNILKKGTITKKSYTPLLQIIGKSIALKPKNK